jgi:putative RecB family exonuclease
MTLMADLVTGLPYDHGMFLVPTSLSPSRVQSFLSCPMAFRFASIEKIPEPPSVHTTRGSLVHRALELLFMREAPDRTATSAISCLQVAISEYLIDPEFTQLGLTETQAETFFAEAEALVHAYLNMEDPRTIREIGLELRLEAAVGPLTLRGIIDRLELDAQGELIVTDYKTGRAPSAHYEQSSFSGVHFYSFLCQAVLGRRPAKIRLMYLKSGEIIEATPSEQSVRAVTTRTTAVWKAVEKACLTDNFQPRPSGLCGGCSFKKWCPAFGGDPTLAAAEAPLALATVAVS